MSATVATGPAAGAAAMNPWAQMGGMALMGLASGVAGGQPGFATGQNNSPLDSSGWNVNFGAGRIDSEFSKKDSQAGQMDAYLPYAVMFVVAMVVWRITKK